MKVWSMLVIVGVISYGLRILPLLFKHMKVTNQDSLFFRFMDYMVCGIIGGIVYLTAFHAQDVVALTSHFNKIDLLKIITLVGVFLYSCRYKNILHNFLIFFSVFAVVSWFMS